MKTTGSFLLVILTAIISTGYASKAEDQLFEDLLYFYRPEIRPVKNESEKVVITFGSSLIRLIGLDELNQVLTTNLWLEMRWTDPKLIWKPDNYDNITKLHVPADQIWLPDIVLYNNAAGMPHVTIYTDAMVYYDGTVVWSPPAIYKSFCEIDIRWFPYDMQKCEMKFGGWTHEGTKMDMIQIEQDEVQIIWERNDAGEMEKVWFVANGMDLSKLVRNAGWDLLNVTSKRHEKTYPGCCGLLYYIDITYYFSFRRKTLFYTVNLVIPCMLIAFLTTMVFYLPAHSRAKITFSISIMVTLSVFFLVLVDLIPPTAIVIPLIGQYLLFTMMLVSISIAISVVTLNIHHRSGNTHKMPRWVRKVFLEALPGYLCIKPPEGQEGDEEGTNNENLAGISLSPGLFHIKPPGKGSPQLPQGPGLVSGTKLSQYRQHSPSIPSFPCLANVPQFHSQDGGEETARRTRVKECSGDCHPYIIARMIENVNYIAHHFRDMEAEEKESEEWSYVAMVIDRIFFLIFTLVNILGTMAIILSAPTIWDTTPHVKIPASSKPLVGDTLGHLYA